MLNRNRPWALTSLMIASRLTCLASFLATALLAGCATSETAVRPAPAAPGQAGALHCYNFPPPSATIGVQLATATSEPPLSKPAPVQFAAFDPQSALPLPVGEGRGEGLQTAERI